MEIKSLDHKGSFSIIDNNKELFSASYEKAFSTVLNANFNGINLSIQPMDNWRNKFEIIKDEVTAGDIVFKLNGEIIIRPSNQIKNSSEWIVKKKGFTSFHFEVSDKTGEILIVLEPTSFDAKTYRFSYEIKMMNDGLVDDDMIELVIYSVFGVNLYKTKQDNMEI